MLPRDFRLAAVLPLLAVLISPAFAQDKKPGESGKPIKPVKPIEQEDHGPPRDVAAIATAIDREIDQRLAGAKVPASPLADDAEFLRRVYLDLMGHIPSLERTKSFLDSSEPDKRRKLIDELIASPEFGRHMADVWKPRIAPRDISNTKPQPDAFSPWLAEQFNRNRGWDRLAYDLLTAEGELKNNPQTAFIMANAESFQPQPNLLAAAASRVFLGVQLQCAECHNHPFTTWKQADFWGMAAFFGRVRNGVKTKPAGISEEPDPNAPDVKNGGVARPEVKPDGSIVIPGTGGNKGAGKVVPAKFLGGEPLTLDDKTLRPRFAAWVIAPENRYFANAFVNRTWAQMFGRGLVNPVDNFHDDNPPSHPALLKLLADEFRASNHDIKHLVRCLCNSQAYQRTSKFLPENGKDAELFSHMSVKGMSPEMLYDSLAIVLGPEKMAGAPKPGTGKGPPLSSRDEFVHFFRGPGDADSSECNQGIPQFLRRMNTEMFNEGAPLIDRLVKARATPVQVVETLYLATLSRRPTEEETKLMSAYLAKRERPEQGHAGVLWILLNSGEFVLNH